MSATITANELKVKGVSAISKSISGEKEIFISVRGKPEYVVLPVKEYNHLRECELESALKESLEDYKKGKFKSESVDRHLKRITNA